MSNGSGPGPGPYDFPRYYDIAFSFRDIAHEVDVMEECIRRSSLVPVKSVLEPACGTAPHMVELARRGYAYSGIDLSAPMLARARQRASEAGLSVRLEQADMVHFRVAEPGDFAFVLLGSLYVRSPAELDTHLQSVAAALRTGALYLLDWCVHFGPQPPGQGEDWEIEQDGVRVKASVSYRPAGAADQVYEEQIVLDVDDRGQKHRLAGTALRLMIQPQEFLQAVVRSGTFEFVGWWNDWNLNQPLDKAKRVNRPITLLRRM